MAVGDAMGSAVRGLKPETIAQCFRQMDGFKDVKPFIGKGVKHYKMQGLYGAQTQNALVICDTLLKHKNLDLDEMAARFQALTLGGPEGYFGVYRRPEACFRKTVSSFSSPDDPSGADRGPSTGAYLATAIPIALYYHNRPQTDFHSVKISKAASPASRWPLPVPLVPPKGSWISAPIVEELMYVIPVSRYSMAWKARFTSRV